MDPIYQVIIGTAVGSLILGIYKSYKDYVKKSKDSNESQKLATASIIIGLSGIILMFIGSIVGLILGIISYRRKKFKTLSVIGILISTLTLLPWIAMLIFRK